MFYEYLMRNISFRDKSWHESMLSAVSTFRVASNNQLTSYLDFIESHYSVIHKQCNLSIYVPLD